MATNEIAAAVQCGQANVLELWRMCRRYAMQQATRWHRVFERSGGVELDDLEQSAFIGRLKAVQTWKPESGAFSTWYTLQLRAVFVEAYGMRTKRTREDPLNKSHLSLDMPLDENEDGSFIKRDITSKLDFGTASVDFGASGVAAIGNSIASGVGALASGGSGSIVINLTTELDGAVLARKMVPYNAAEALRIGT